MIDSVEYQQLEYDLERHREINSCMADWIWEVDAQGIYIFAAGNVKKILGYDESDLIGKSPFDFMSDLEASRVGSLFGELASNQAPIVELENWNIHKDGSAVCLLTSGVPVLDSDGKLLGYRGIDKDITAEKKSHEEIMRHKMIFDSVKEAIVITDLHGVIVDVNPAYEVITGYQRDEIVGEYPSKLKSNYHDAAFYNAMWSDISSKGSWEGEIWDRRKNGEIFPKWLSINTFYDGYNIASGYVGLFSDISDKKASEEKLINLAFYDPLTSLPNRSNFHESLIHALSMVKQKEEQLALYYIDLDNFKYINDTFGHNAGDNLLLEVSIRMKEFLREEDTLARLGGDEFAVIHTGKVVDHMISIISTRILDSLLEPFTVMGHEIQVGASIGVSVYPHDGLDAEILIRNADTAMYDAKKRGTRNYQSFTHELHQRSQDRLHLENDLRRAIKNEEFELHYQPQIDITCDKLIGSEALIRWTHPTRGIISPAEFIPTAEETGMIIEIGAWVFKKACSYLRECIDSGRDPVRVAINLSAKQFSDNGLIKMIKSTLEREKIPVDLIELEITESTLMDNADQTVEILNEISKLGISIAMDDFGTGYSSLAYLKNFPVNKIKIDREFIRGLPDSKDDALLTSAMISLSNNLGVEVLAEGAETEGQVEFLRQHGCKYIQGFYYSKPLPPEEFMNYVDSMQNS